MKVIVSACLAGDNCKYNGGNNLNQKMMDFLKSHEMIKVCPEVLGGLPTPRPSAEIVDGKVMNTEGKNITKEFSLGAQKAFEIVQKSHQSYSNISPPRLITMTRQGRNFPLALRASVAARSSPPQQGTSILTIVRLFMLF